VTATRPDPGEERAIRVRRVREGALVGALYVVSAALAAIASSTGVRIAAFSIFGVAGVLAVCFVFYEIGLSEDRDRARGRL
jgi:hypothetical protein